MVRVSDNERDARKWLDEQRAELAKPVQSQFIRHDLSEALDRIDALLAENARLVAALSAAGEDARKRDEWECHIAAMNSELATKLDAAEAALSAATTERDEALAQVGAATTILAEAEKIVPGVITTAGRFSIGLNDRERAVAAEQALARTQEVLTEARTFIERARPLLGIGMGNSLGKQADDLYVSINAALAAAAPVTTLNEPEGEA